MQPTDIKVPENTTILIVEDDPDQMRLLVKYIREAIGCNIKEAADGLEALRIMLQEKPKPNLILLDLMLPYLSGVEFLSLVRGRSEFDDIPVIVCTAISDTNEIKGKISHHIHSYLVKPIHKARLLEKVLDALHPILFRVDYQS
ncbi:MAG: response regulator [bacterium]